MELAKQVKNFNKATISESWSVEVNFDTKNQPILERGLKFMAEKQDLLLAICLNNGYYNRENIYRMLKFSLNFSDRVQVFFTDGPAKHNFRARGYSDDKIIRESRLDRNRLRNHCLNAMERIKAKQPQKTITFLDWENIYHDPEYLKEYNYLTETYNTNEEFKNDINSTTYRVLQNRLGPSENIQSKIPIAIKYVTEELAFILAYENLSADTKPIADHGSNGFSYTYYERWPVFEKLVDGKFDGKIREKIGFVIVKI